MGLALPSVKQVNILLMVGRTAISIMDSLYNRLFIWITLGNSKHATLTVPQNWSEKAKAAQIHDYKLLHSLVCNSRIEYTRQDNNQPINIRCLWSDNGNQSLKLLRHIEKFIFKIG